MSLPTRERTLATTLGAAAIAGMATLIFMGVLAYCQEQPKPATPKLDDKREIILNPGSGGADWFGKQIDPGGAPPPPFGSTSSTGSATFWLTEPMHMSYRIDLSYMEKADYVDILFKIDGRDQSVRISAKTFVKLVRDGLGLLMVSDPDIGLSRQVGK